MHRLQELVRLHRMQTKVREIARLLKMSPNTEREYRQILLNQGLLEGPVEKIPELEVLKDAILANKPLQSESSPQEKSSIEAWADAIATLMKKGLKARAIYDRLCLEEKNFQGSYWAVKRFVRRLKKAQGIIAQDVAIPVITTPGQVAQVDFGYVGKLLDPEKHILRRAWVFVMTLGYSRHFFAKVVFNQKTETFLQMHIEAFQYFGGVVETVVPDNLKAAIIRTAFGHQGDVELNRSYRELARHYGFKIDPTPPYAPKKKGKVESTVKYVKNNVLAGREGEPITTVNTYLARFIQEIAGLRLHPTTAQQPLVHFTQEEQPTLSPLPIKPFETVLWRKAKVHMDSHVQFCKKLYSVPWRFIGKEVWLKATMKSLLIFSDDVRIATHSRTFKDQRSTVEEHLPEHRRDLRHRSFQYWENRAFQIGPETAGLISEIFSSDKVLSQLRPVQAMVTYLETFPKERAENASKRARFYGTYTYRGLKRILQKALDMEPLPLLLIPNKNTVTKPPRFARNLRQMLNQSVEVEDEFH